MPNTVVVSAVAEYRADGSYWIQSTVNGAPYTYRWTKPLDIVPGGQAVAQAISDRYNRLVAAAAPLLGQTIVVPATAIPPIAYTVVFSATAASVYTIPGATTIALTATVNGVSTTVQLTQDEFIEQFSATPAAAATALAAKLAKTYAESLRWGAQYVGTFTTN
jgi:hypothetical protein